MSIKQRLPYGPYSMVMFILLVLFCFTATTTAFSLFNSPEAVQLSVNPTTIEDDSTPLKVTWSGVTGATQNDIIAFYLVPNSYTGKLPVEAGYPYLNTLGYYKVIDYDTTLSGTGVVNVDIFYPRDYSFYFEYIKIVPASSEVEQIIPSSSSTTNNQQLGENDYQAILRARFDHPKVVEYRKKKLITPLYHDFTILAYSGLIKDSLKIQCSQFHLSFTHQQDVFTLGYTTLDNTATHFLHISENPDQVNAYIYNHDTQRQQQSLEDFIKQNQQRLYLKASSPAAQRLIAQYHQYTQAVQQGFSMYLPVEPHASDFATYDIKDMTESPANETFNFVNPGWFRFSNFTLPKPNTVYYYRIRNELGEGISKTYKMITPTYNTAKATATTTDLFVFGDAGVGFPFYSMQGQQYHAPNTYKSIATVIEQLQERYGVENFFAHVLNIGDLSYSRGIAFQNEYWMKLIEPLASQFPYQIAMGNHEIITRIGSPYEQFTNGTDSGGEAGIPYYRRFKMPDDWHHSPYSSNSWINNAATQFHQKWFQRNIAYSYNTGVVHMIVLSSEHMWGKDSAQYNFFIKDLQNLNRTATPWAMVAFHRPMYCAGQGCTISSDPPNPDDNRIDYELRQLIAPLMKQYNVQLSLTGHVHHVSRSYPVDPNSQWVGVKDFVHPKTGKVTPVTWRDRNTSIQHHYAVAPIHLVSGAGGNPFDNPLAPYVANTHGGMATVNEKTHDIPKWLAMRLFGIYGYYHLRANQTHLIGTFYNNEYTTIHDQFVLVDPNVIAHKI